MHFHEFIPYMDGMWTFGLKAKMAEFQIIFEMFLSSPCFTLCWIREFVEILHWQIIIEELFATFTDTKYEEIHEIQFWIWEIKTAQSPQYALWFLAQSILQIVTPL